VPGKEGFSEEVAFEQRPSREGERTAFQAEGVGSVNVEGQKQAWNI
jgi:hypothetical protein